MVGQTVFALPHCGTARWWRHACGVQGAGHPPGPLRGAEAGVPISGLARNLYPIYLRGHAYFLAQKGKEAAVEFQKILDHRSIVLNSPSGGRPQLGLGRPSGLEGETAKAPVAHHDFLALGKTADPNIPILRQAKAEYAKLK